MEHPISTYHAFAKHFYIQLADRDLEGHVQNITRSDGSDLHPVYAETMHVQDMKQFVVRFYNILIKDEIELEMLRQCILESYVENISVDVRGKRGSGRRERGHTSKDKIATNLQDYIHIGDECSFNITCDIVAWNYDKLNKPLGG